MCFIFDTISYMKHATVKAVKTNEMVPPTKTGAARNARKTLKPEALEPLKKSEAKVERNPNISKNKQSKKTTDAPAAVQKVKRQLKIAPVLPEIELAAEITKTKILKIEPPVIAAKNKQMKKAKSSSGKDPEKKQSETAKPSAEQLKIDTDDAKTVTATAPRKSKPKKVKPIGAAIFRGKKERYGFQVYPLDAEFEDVSAIYVISKRKIDKQKRGHHALVCIGQTDSILGEIKRHKNKCIKKHNANVISILLEENEKKRLRIEEDLKSAHAIACGI